MVLQRAPSEPKAVVAVRGTFIHAPAYGELEVLSGRTLIFDNREGHGQILYIGEGPGAEAELEKHAIDPDQVITVSEEGFFIPGFIDCHLHAPQYRFAGTKTATPLLQWLKETTFPTEAKCTDLAYAQKIYSAVVSRTLANGTTTVLYFASLDLAPSKLLADICKQQGQRAYVGKVSVDRNSEHKQSLAQSLQEAEEFDTYVRGLGTDLVQPAVTPRFVPTCSSELLEGLGKLAERTGSVVQSHISESSDNQAFVASEHPEFGRDTPLYDKHRLLTPRTVMAHGVCLLPDELRVLAERGTGIAHCPLSNFFFAGWPLDVDACREAGVKVGLGTDVAGGYSPSILENIRNAVVNGKVLQYLKTERRRQRQLAEGVPTAEIDRVTDEFDEPTMDFRHGFYLATRGGAECLGLKDTVGSFEVGKRFDALLVDTATTAAFDAFPGDTVLDRFEKFVNLGDDRNIRAVWVNGRLVRWT